MKRILLVALLVIMWVSGSLLLDYYGKKPAPVATNPPTIQSSSPSAPVAPKYSPPAPVRLADISKKLLDYYGEKPAPVATNPPTIQSSSPPAPVAPKYSPPAYSPPASSYWDYSPAWDYSSNDVDVRGYYRKDGTYVKPYSRTKPDGIPYNNYGYPGNYNPNTGQISR